MTEAEEKFARLLLDDYNFYRLQTRHVFDAESPWIGKPLVPKPERLKLLLETDAWCRARNMNVRLWLIVLFKARAWRFAPKLEKGHLMSEKIVPKYRTAKGLGFFRYRTMSAPASQARESQEPDVNRDLIHVVEAQKARYAESDQRERCMNEALIRTLGYHPKSPVCRECPLAAPCAVRLQASVSFDVTSLRAGLITLDEAMQQRNR